MGAARVGDVISIGAKMESFSMPDADGKQQTLDNLKGKNGTVLMFLSTQCPFVNVYYKERIAQLAKDYNSKGINFVGINSNVSEYNDAAKLKSNAKDNDFAFPLLIDKNSAFALKIGAQKTPEIFLLDKDGKLVYHGAIDNDREGANITQSYLRDALDAVIAGKSVAKAETVSIGCTIKTPKQ
jgi:peroxiredoxin